MKKNSHLLIFLHFAGGSHYSLKDFEKEIHAACLFIELPGRGKRFSEPLITDINAAVTDVIAQMEPVLYSYDSYSIFGHSMGSLLAYLTIHRLLANNKKLPVHLFVSGRGGPSIPKKDKTLTYKLPSNDFWSEISDKNGTPQEILNNEELKEFFEPILRADFQIVEAYSYASNPKLTIPITGFHGDDNDATIEEMEAWNLETNQSFTRHQFSGGHFFIFEHREAIARVINGLDG